MTPRLWLPLDFSHTSCCSFWQNWLRIQSSSSGCLPGIWLGRIKMISLNSLVNPLLSFHIYWHLYIWNTTYENFAQGLECYWFLPMNWLNFVGIFVKVAYLIMIFFQDKLLTFSFKKMGLNVSSAKWPPFCLGLNVLISDLLMAYQLACYQWEVHVIVYIVPTTFSHLFIICRGS